MSAQDGNRYIHLTPTAASVTATGEATNSHFVGFPVIIRQFHVLPMVSGLNYATGGLSCRLMIQDTASGSTASAVCTVTGTTGDIAGKLIVKKGLNTEWRPGKRIYVNNDAVVSGAATAHFGVVVAPKWEEPENFDSVRVLT